MDFSTWNCNESDTAEQLSTHTEDYGNDSDGKESTCHAGGLKSLSHVRLFATPWTVVYQVPPSMAFSRQEYWSGLPFPFPGDLSDPGIEPGSPTFLADALTSEPRGKPCRRPWVGKIPWRRESLPTPVFCPGEFYGQRNLGFPGDSGVQSTPASAGDESSIPGR